VYTPKKGTFEAIWNDLAKEGWVDAWGSAECRRVWDEWIAARCPPEIRQFILRRANVPVKGDFEQPPQGRAGKEHGE
jgi:hypothetical protein